MHPGPARATNTGGISDSVQTIRSHKVLSHIALEQGCYIVQLSEADMHRNGDHYAAITACFSTRGWTVIRLRFLLRYISKTT